MGAWLNAALAVSSLFPLLSRLSLFPSIVAFAGLPHLIPLYNAAPWFYF